MNTLRTTVNGKLVLHEFSFTINVNEIHIKYFKGLKPSYLSFDESQYFKGDFEPLEMYDVGIVNIENCNIYAIKEYECKLSDVNIKVGENVLTEVTLSFLIKN